MAGGAGFIGLHLCEQLLNEGADTLCVDKFFTGTKDNIRRTCLPAHASISRATT